MTSNHKAMGSDLPEVPDHPDNQAILGYLQDRSCHSDIGIPFERSARAAGLDIFCSNPKQFGYLVAYRDGRIVAFAQGMHGISLKRPHQAEQSLLSSGAQSIPELPGWVQVPLYGPHEFEKALSTLLQMAGK